jgi:hypothetical protein
MSTRRMETTIEQLRNKMTNQAVELGKKSDIVNRLNLERNELKAEVTNLRREGAGSQTTSQRPRQSHRARSMDGAESNIRKVKLELCCPKAH